MKLIIICIGLLFFQKGFSQPPFPTKLISGVPDIKFYDSIHKLNKSALAEFDSTFKFYVSFMVVKSGQIKDIEYGEVPGFPIPEKVKSYLTDLLMHADGKWQLDSLNQKEEEIIYKVELVKLGNWRKEFEIGHPSQYFLDDSKYVMDAVPMIKRFHNKKRLLIMDY